MDGLKVEWGSDDEELMERMVQGGASASTATRASPTPLYTLLAASQVNRHVLQVSAEIR